MKLQVSPCGQYLILLSPFQSTIQIYEMAVLHTPATAMINYETFNFTAQDVTPEWVYISPDGLSLSMYGRVTDKIYSYSFSTPWKVFTLTHTSLDLML